MAVPTKNIVGIVLILEARRGFPTLKGYFCSGPKNRQKIYTQRGERELKKSKSKKRWMPVIYILLVVAIYGGRGRALFHLLLG